MMVRRSGWCTEPASRRPIQPWSARRAASPSPPATCAPCRRTTKPEENPMPEAVIVATARSPIGRAFKGSLIDIRPDDLAAQMVKAVMAKVPQLPPAEIEDLMLGCGLPGGEQGFNMARVVSIL